jgi:hypothetical protein
VIELIFALTYSLINNLVLNVTSRGYHTRHPHVIRFEFGMTQSPHAASFDTGEADNQSVNGTLLVTERRLGGFNDGSIAVRSASSAENGASGQGADMEGAAASVAAGCRLTEGGRSHWVPQLHRLAPEQFRLIEQPSLDHRTTMNIDVAMEDQSTDSVHGASHRLADFGAPSSSRVLYNSYLNSSVAETTSSESHRAAAMSLAGFSPSLLPGGLAISSSPSCGRGYSISHEQHYHHPHLSRPPHQSLPSEQTVHDATSQEGKKSHITTHEHLHSHQRSYLDDHDHHHHYRSVNDKLRDENLAVFSWGRGEDGQLGLGDTCDQEEPTFGT